MQRDLKMSFFWRQHSAHSSAVVKILSCLFFPCPVVSETLFRHVILLFDINTNGHSLLWFHAYLAGTNLVSCFFTGGLAVSMTGNIPSWCFLITTSLVCLFNLLHSLAFLVLTLYVGLQTSHNMATAAVTFFILAVLQETLKNQIKADRDHSSCITIVYSGSSI